MTLNDAMKEDAVFQHIHKILAEEKEVSRGSRRKTRETPGEKSGSRRKKARDVFFWVGLEQKRRSWWYPNGRKVDIQTDYFSLGAPSHPCVTIGPFDPRRAQSKKKMWITKSCRDMNRIICEYPILSQL